jgi:hypothetical protein
MLAMATTVAAPRRESALEERPRAERTTIVSHAPLDPVFCRNGLWLSHVHPLIVSHECRLAPACPGTMQNPSRFDGCR